MSGSVLTRALIAAIALWLATWNLGAYPLTWFDEGIHLQVPKTLTREGVYAARSSEGYRVTGPVTGVGPTLLLPIAASFRIWGVGLRQARVIAALYLLAAMGLFIALSTDVADRTLALAALGLLIASPTTAFLEYGRQVLGEVPALAFLLAGLLIWFRAWERPSTWLLAFAGACFGLALATKIQSAIYLLPTMVAAWMLDRWYYQRLTARVFAIPLMALALVVLAWVGALLFLVGGAGLAESVTLVRAASASAALVFSPSLMGRALRSLLGPGAYLGVLPLALAYWLWLSTERTSTGQRRSIVALLILANFAWYVLASIGWSRYAFPGLALAAIVVAQALVDASRHLRARTMGMRVLRVCTAGLLCAGLGVSLWWTIAGIVRPPPDDPSEMARYLDAHVDQLDVIETWEPEMGFLTQHAYHYPPASLLPEAVAFVWSGGPEPWRRYDFAANGYPQYVLVGRFAGWVNVYAPDRLNKKYWVKARIGDYVLFERRQE